MTSYLYHSTGFRAVRADSAKEAANVFATRIARREYGRRGYCRTLRLDSASRDGASGTYQAFIGIDVGGGTTSGHTVWVYVDCR